MLAGLGRPARASRGAVRARRRRLRVATAMPHPAWMSRVLQAPRLALAGLSGRRLQLLARAGVGGRGGRCRATSRRSSPGSRTCSGTGRAAPTRCCSPAPAGPPARATPRHWRRSRSWREALAPSAERLLETALQGAAFAEVTAAAWSAPTRDQPHIRLPSERPLAQHRIPLDQAAAALPAGLRRQPGLGRDAAGAARPDRRPAGVGGADAASCATVAAEAIASTIDDLGRQRDALRHRLHAARDPRRRGSSAHELPQRPAAGRHRRPGRLRQDHADRRALQAACATATRLAAITNDIYTREDARVLTRAQALPLDRIIGVETGGCPHTAIREDASVNLAAVSELRARHPRPRADPDRERRRQPGRDLQPGARRPDDLRDRRRGRRRRSRARAARPSPAPTCS